MKFISTILPGVYIIEPEIYSDDRGDFWRVFCKNEFGEAGIQFDTVQASRSYTKKKGTIRGMHFQKEPSREDKIVQCIRGKVFDVVVDLRKDTPTFGAWTSEELTGNNRKMFYIPKGCAHGFQTLEDDCEMFYCMSEFYSSGHASGVRWNDPLFNISWPLVSATVSHEDNNWPFIV